MRLHVLHRTHFKYAGEAAESHDEVRLAPISDADQTAIDFRLSVSPPVHVRSYDEAGGAVHYFNLRPPHAELQILAESVTDTRLEDPFAALEYGTDDWAFYRREAISQEFAEYLAPTRLVSIPAEAAQIADRARAHCGPSVAEFLMELNRLLSGVLKYEPGATTAHTRLDELLAVGRGVCQDFAHLMLAVCRSQRIPCRYVSGYLLSLAGGDALHAEHATHAWAECLLPSGLWRGFDPTNALVANDHYVKIHVGRDYSDVVPVRGVYRGPAAESMTVDVLVTALSADAKQPAVVHNVI